MRRFVIRLALALALVVPPVYAIKVWQANGYTDFLVYHRAAVRAANAQWSQIYDMAADGNSPYRYAPWTLPATLPLSLLSYDHARMLWFALQLACFGGAFWILAGVTANAARAGSNQSRHWFLAFIFLYTLRFCLDSLTIGQVTGPMFLFLALALRAWSGLWVLPTVLLKVGTGILLPLLLLHPLKRNPGESRSVRAIKTSGLWIGALALLGIANLAWTGLNAQASLWDNWFYMLSKDAQFFDSSHYGSQSLNSALLRLAKHGWLNPASALNLRLALSILVCTGIFWIWARKRPESAHARLSYFSLGITAYLLLMPFTFKYSMPLLAFPVAALLSSPKIDRFDLAALGFGALTLSLAGPVFYGYAGYSWVHHNSLPFVAMSWIGIAVFRKSLHA